MNRATTSEERRAVIEELLSEWERHSSLRLGQLVCYLADQHHARNGLPVCSADPFYTEDYDLLPGAKS